MNKTAISWTKYTNNPIRFRVLATGKTGWHCEKVSQGCKHCYAETLNMRLGSGIPFTVGATEQHECWFDDRMAGQIYTIKDEHARVFPFDMTDIFGAFIPDHIRAAAWAVMLDNPQLDFQVLTKRAASTVTWPERFAEAQASDAYARLAESITHKRVKAAMLKRWPTPWADNIWMGASVESAETLGRIEFLRQCGAQTKFISAEPLLGAWGPDVDLSGIDWIIVGGESGKHLTGPEHPRWMQMAWAREIRDLCVAQGVAFFFKQDSGVRTEMRPYLVEENGTLWRWHQYPGDLAAPVQVDKQDRPLAQAEPTAAPEQTITETLPPAVSKPAGAVPNTPVMEALSPIRTQYLEIKRQYPDHLVLFQLGDFYELFDEDAEIAGRVLDLVVTSRPMSHKQRIPMAGVPRHSAEPYISRLVMSGYNVAVVDQVHEPTGTLIERQVTRRVGPEAQAEEQPQTTIANFKIVKDHWDVLTRRWDDERYVYIGRWNAHYNLPVSVWHNPYTGENAIERYRVHITGCIRANPEKYDLEALRGKVLTCWCYPNPCHGDVLLELLGEARPAETAQREDEHADQPVQMTLL